MPSPSFSLVAAFVLIVPVAPAAAQEVFTGASAHGVDTPLTFATHEGGADLQLGYRFARIEELRFLGKPAPYLIGSLNSEATLLRGSWAQLETWIGEGIRAAGNRCGRA